MTHRSPLVTLIGLVAAFAIMLGVNAAGTGDGATADPGATPSATAAATSPALPPTSAPHPTSAPPATSAPPSPSTPPTPSPSDEGEQFPGQAVYVGRTKDRSTAVAIAVRGDQAAAYLCDGKRLESWLRGTVDGDTVRLKSKRGTTLTATLRAGQLFGVVEVDGDRLTFSLERAPSPAGIYRARGAKTTIGWIVLPDGSQVGLATTGGQSVPAPELNPGNPRVSVGGESLQGQPVTGDQDV